MDKDFEELVNKLENYHKTQRLSKSQIKRLAVMGRDLHQKYSEAAELAKRLYTVPPTKKETAARIADEKFNSPGGPPKHRKKQSGIHYIVDNYDTAMVKYVQDELSGRTRDRGVNVTAMTKDLSAILGRFLESCVEVAED
jgi:hypothetical protein